MITLSGFKGKQTFPLVLGRVGSSWVEWVWRGYDFGYKEPRVVPLLLLLPAYTSMILAGPRSSETHLRWVSENLLGLASPVS